MHVCYRDDEGLIWDAWYDGPTNSWNLQQINGGGRTNGPAAVGDPAVAQFVDQMHVCYRDDEGLIWDAWYDGPTNSWNLQQINGGGHTDGPTGVGDPAVAEFVDQMHVCYRDDEGLIWDAWYDGPTSSWNLQQINGGGRTNGPVAVGDPAVAPFLDQMHVCYRDDEGLIWDAWYDGPTSSWSLQEPAGSTAAKYPAAGDPAVAQFVDQMHVCYRIVGGVLMDAWYDGTTSSWTIKQMTGPVGETSGPASSGDPHVAQFTDQIHICYRDEAGVIFDVWYEDNSACNVPGYPTDTLQLIGRWKGTQDSALGLEEVMVAIEYGQPILIRIAWNNGSGAHCITIDGFDASGPGDPTIDVQDPKFGHSTCDFTTFPTTYMGGAQWTTTYFTEA